MREFLRIFSVKMMLVIIIAGAAAAIIFYQNNEKTESGGEEYLSTKVYAYLNILFDDYIDKKQAQVKSQSEMEVDSSVQNPQAKTYALMRLKRVKDMAQWEIVEIKDYTEYQANGYGEKIAAIKEQYPDIYAYYQELKNEKPDVLRQYVEDDKEIEFACDIFTETIEYADNYHSMIEQAINQGNSMLLSPMYSDKNTFGHMNIIKSKYDYKKLLNRNVKPDNSKALEAVIQSSSYVNIIVLVIVFICVFRFFEERKNGLWHIVNLGAEGRYRLGIVRVVTLFIVCLLSVFIIYSILCVIAFLMYGGAKSMGGVIQNSMVYGTVGLLVNKWEFLLLFLLVTALGAFAAGLIMWIIMSAINNNTLGIAASLAVLSGSYIMYAFIPDKSIFNFLKYINIWCAIYTGESFCRFANWGYGAFITDTTESTVLFIVILILLCVVATVLINGKKKPVSKICALAKITEKISQCVETILEKMPCFIKESYKLLISQRTVLVLAVLVFIAMENQVAKGYSFASGMSVAEDYYEEAQGLSVGEELDDIVRRYENKFETLKTEQAYIKASLAGGEKLYTNEDLQRINREYTLYENGINEIHRNITNITELYQKGIKVTVQSPFVIEEVLGEKLFHNQRLYGILEIFGAVILSFGFFSYEKKQNMTILIHSSGNGRFKWFVRKAAVSGLWIAILWGVLSAINWNNIYKIYFLKDIDMNVLIQSYPLMSEFPIVMTTGEYFLIIYLWKLIMMLSISWIVMLLSVMFEYSKSLVTSVILLVPHFLLEIGMTYFYPLSVVMPMCQTENWIVIRNAANGYLYGIMIFIMGIVSILRVAVKVVIRQGK